MQILSRLLASVGLVQQPSAPDDTPDYEAMMKGALDRIRIAENQIREAASLEELDVGRSALLAAQAEVVRLVRTAKRERGFSLRPVSECEEMHRHIVNVMAGRDEERVNA